MRLWIGHRILPGFYVGVSTRVDLIERRPHPGRWVVLRRDLTTFAILIAVAILIGVCEGR